MKFGLIAGCGAMLATTLGSQGLAAQSLRDWDRGASHDVRANAAITIPLGVPSRSRVRKPRLEFSFEAQRTDRLRSVTFVRFDPDFERQTFQAANVAFTLERNPRLLLNGERVAIFGPRLTADQDKDTENEGGLGVAGGLLLGLGAAIAGGFIIAEVVKDDLEDSIRGDD
ncbi:MAG: hypothetical protein AAFN48_05185 [Pseudomonadota bacterium]